MKKSGHTSILKPVIASLRLIGTRDSWRLGIVSLIQFILSGLDLLGVLLVGGVAALALSPSDNSSSPEVLNKGLNLFGLGGLDRPQQIVALALIAAGILVLKSVISAVLVRRTLLFLALRQAVVSASLSSKLLQRPMLELQRRSTHETTFALTQGVSAATSGLLGNASIALNEVGLMLVLGIALLMLDPLATMGAVIYFSLVGFVLARLLGHRLAGLGEQQSVMEISSYNVIQEAILSYREIAVTSRREFYAERIRDLRWQAAVVGAGAQFLSQIPKYVMELAMVFGGILLAGGLFLSRDLAAATSTLVVFVAASSRVMPSVMRLQASTLAIRLSAGVAQPTYELAAELRTMPTSVLSVNESRFDQSAPKSKSDFVPDLELHSVSMTYPGTMNPAIRECSFSVSAGTSLAIVGPSGAGKSTLADLILGILLPDEGEIWLGGVPPRSAISIWPGQIGYVPQDVFIGNGTIRENVALGLPRELVDDSLVWQSLDRAHLGETVRGSSAGLDTVVGERGLRFSGGQRQRIGLARALYPQPHFLVLDEATSALDAETERAITAALGDMHGSVTTVTIAHRLATVVESDLVAYVDDGALRAIGTFDSVRTAIPAFDRQANLLGLNIADAPRAT